MSVLADAGTITLTLTAQEAAAVELALLEAVKPILELYSDAETPSKQALYLSGVSTQVSVLNKIKRAANSAGVAIAASRNGGSR